MYKDKTTPPSLPLFHRHAIIKALPHYHHESAKKPLMAKSAKKYTHKYITSAIQTPPLLPSTKHHSLFYPFLYRPSK